MGDIESRTKPTSFDRFATWSSRVVSRAGFFAFCVLLIVVWAPTILVFPSVDTWQLVINTATTIVTFLLVALIQNTQRRAEDAIQRKLDAIASALAAAFDHEVTPDDQALREAAAALRRASAGRNP